MSLEADNRVHEQNSTLFKRNALIIAFVCGAVWAVMNLEEGRDGEELVTVVDDIKDEVDAVMDGDVVRNTRKLTSRAKVPDVPLELVLDENGLLDQGAATVLAACRQILEGKVEGLVCRSDSPRGFTCHNSREGFGLLPVSISTDMPTYPSDYLPPENWFDDRWVVKFEAGHGGAGVFPDYEVATSYEASDDLKEELGDTCNEMGDLLNTPNEAFKDEDLCSFSDLNGDDDGGRCDRVLEFLEQDEEVVVRLGKEDSQFENELVNMQIKYFKTAIGDYEILLDESEGGIRVVMEMEMRMSLGPRKIRYSIKKEDGFHMNLSGFNTLLGFLFSLDER